MRRLAGLNATCDFLNIDQSVGTWPGNWRKVRKTSKDQLVGMQRCSLPSGYCGGVPEQGTEPLNVEST